MIKKTQNKIQRICQKHFVSRLNSNNETTSTTSSTQLIDPTEKEITAAKAAGEKAYSETGRSQTFSTVAATANFNGHTIPDGYTVIYAKDGVIVAVNGSMSADKTALQGVTKAIAFIDNRPDIHNLFIGSTVNGTTITFPKSIYMGVATAGNTIDSVTPNADKSYSFTPSTWGGLPAGGGMSTFSIGIQLAMIFHSRGTRSKMGRSLMVREMFQIFQPIKQRRFRSMRIGQELFLIQSMVEQQKSERTGLHYLESMWVTKWLSLQQQ